MNSDTQLTIVVAGHVDHGKSTVIGRLLSDTGSLPQGRLEAVRAMCAEQGRPFEYAFLLDALKDEQAQNITIDTARIFFNSANRSYQIVDAPGHIEFLKNMVSGAARAEAALLVIDAAEGVAENSRRHGYLLAMLGVRQLAVLVNKMDLCNYERVVFERISEEYGRFLQEIGLQAAAFIPVSGREGSNIAAPDTRLDWYRGGTVLEQLDRFVPAPAPVDNPFRLYVQGVYRFTGGGDQRRIVAGEVDSGRLRVGDQVVFYPSGKKSRVATIEAFNAPRLQEAQAGQAAGFTLEEQLYVTRGEVACRQDEPKPDVARRLRVSLFWLGRQALHKKKNYLLKMGTARVGARLEDIERVIDGSDLSTAAGGDEVRRHEVAECVLVLERALAVDPGLEGRGTNRFVLVDGYEIAGGGLVREALPDRLSWVREKVLQRNFRWQASNISIEDRAEKYNQRAALVLLSGPLGAGKKEVAKELETRLFAAGRIVYFLGIGNVKYGLDADVANGQSSRDEHLRRLAEAAYLLLDAGVILLVTARDLRQADLEIIKTIVPPEWIETIWVGEEKESDLACDLRVSGRADVEESAREIRDLLQARGIIYKPWKT